MNHSHIKQTIAISLLVLTAFLNSCKREVIVKQPGVAERPAPINATAFVTARDSDLRLTKMSAVPFEYFGQPKETQVCVFVDPGKTFQTMLGIGGALTDASAEVFAKLPATKQKELLEAYYNPEKGIGYTLARTNIASCDFSSDSYSYVRDGDSLLSSFNVDHDLKYRIPFIKQAISAAGGKLRMYVSPWSPPAWMKDNKDLLHGGKLLSKYNQLWADHYIKFIKAYESQGYTHMGSFRSE